MSLELAPPFYLYKSTLGGNFTNMYCTYNDNLYGTVLL